ncbi:hypothetical protein [Thalassobaculum salexigens]|uniref:hypothetical protein n=1 Tax=Thalassobaculum salexigens TaxID=455360 RepID=UPI0004916302|nr:hypothetical protein [Thalassobaculum salexigens]
MALSDERVFYFLEEAFDLLGRHLYASEWDAQEIIARPCPDPDEGDDLRVELGQQFSALTAEIDALKSAIGKTTNAAEVSRLKGESAVLEERRQDVALKRDALPIAGNLERARYARWQRRETAERVLIDAFKAETLKAWSSRGPSMTQITPDLWRGEVHGFTWYLDLSLAVLPQSISSVRRGVIKIQSDDFHKWRSTVPPIATEAQADLPLEDRATLWFRQFVSDHQGPEPKRDSAIWKIRETFPKLSEAAGKRIWAKNAPSAWKRPGPRRTQVR